MFSGKNFIFNDYYRIQKNKAASLVQEEKLKA